MHRELLLKIAEWIKTEKGQEAAIWLTAESPSQLPALTAALGLASLKAAYEHWVTNCDNGSEEFWQKSLEARSFVLSQLFSYPVLVFSTKTYVGGKQITGRGGKHPDFALTATSTNSILFVEIKTPITQLLGTRYRNGVYPLSSEIQGAIAQTLRYRQSLMRSFDSINSETETRFTLGEPHCVVLAGNVAQLTSVAHRECFELQRERLRGITLVTYDELFNKTKGLIDLLEGTNPVQVGSATRDTIRLRRRLRTKASLSV